MFVEDGLHILQTFELFPNQSRVLALFEESVRSYHGLFKRIPLKGELFEELLNNAIVEACPDADVIWNPNGHGSGKDITVNGVELSLKSCALPAKGKLMEYRSFRTTTLKTIEEKTAFLDQKHYDHVLCLARRIFRNDGRKFTVYSMRVVTRPFQYGDLSWKIDSINYSAESDGFKIAIRKSCSDQLIVHVPLSHTSVLTEFDIEMAA